MPQENRQIRFPILTMLCNFHSHDPISLSLPQIRHPFPLPSNPPIPSPPPPLPTRLTPHRLPLTITQTIPPPPPPPKAPSTPTPPLRPQPRYRMKILLRPPTILRHPRLTITPTIPRLEIQRLRIETPRYAVSCMCMCMFSRRAVTGAGGCAVPGGGCGVGAEGAMGVG